MTTTAIVNSGIRFVLLLLLQVFVFQQIVWGWGGKEYLYVFVYPIFLALLPLRTPTPLVIVLGALLGLCIDLFTETLGMHAAAMAFTGFLRPLVLSLLEPRDGYNIKDNPNRDDLSVGWLSRYVAYLLLLNCVWFFTVQSFSFVYWRDILLKVLLTFPASFVVTMIILLIFNPRE